LNYPEETSILDPFSFRFRNSLVPNTFENLANSFYPIEFAR
jgi:hypothetical protein